MKTNKNESKKMGYQDSVKEEKEYLDVKQTQKVFPK